MANDNGKRQEQSQKTHFYIPVFQTQKVPNDSTIIINTARTTWRQSTNAALRYGPACLPFRASLLTFPESRLVLGYGLGTPASIDGFGEYRQMTT